MLSMWVSLLVLNVSGCEFDGNLARGADGVISSGDGSHGIGGAIGNFASATIAQSHFTGNVAYGGNGGSGSAAGWAGGGAIGNAGALGVARSTFSSNQSVGGNDNVGPFSGIATGGAIYTGGAGQSGITLVVSESRFDHNQAIGGNRNLTGGQYDQSWPSAAAGGAIELLYGPSTISGCTLEHNEALGGAGGPGTDGGIAWGGGLNVANDYGIEGWDVTVCDSTVEHNAALGGAGGRRGNGGEARGGGLGSDDAGTLAVINCVVAHNQAQGGLGGAGGKGGNGLGGGLFVAGPDGKYAASTLNLLGVTVSYNLAFGGIATDDGVAGQGIGGGVYRVGTYSADSATVIAKNQAKTSNDNVGP